MLINSQVLCVECSHVRGNNLCRSPTEGVRWRPDQSVPALVLITVSSLSSDLFDRTGNTSLERAPLHRMQQKLRTLYQMFQGHVWFQKKNSE